MLRRIALSLIAVAFAALSAPSYADESRWEVIRVYALAEGRSVAVAVPAEWQDLNPAQALGSGSALSFIDESGKRIEVPASCLEWAFANKRIYRPEHPEKLAMSAPAGS